MKETAIKNLDEDYKNCNVAEKCYQGLIKWQTEKGPEEARTKQLCGALRELPRGIEHFVVARRYVITLLISTCDQAPNLLKPQPKLRYLS